jgi:hypothetical protein
MDFDGVAAGQLVGSTPKDVSVRLEEIRKEARKDRGRKSS